MEYFPAPLENLVEQFAKLPGIGSKSAQRLAFTFSACPMRKRPPLQPPSSMRKKK